MATVQAVELPDRDGALGRRQRTWFVATSISAPAHSPASQTPR